MLLVRGMMMARRRGASRKDGQGRPGRASLRSCIGRFEIPVPILGRMRSEGTRAPSWSHSIPRGSGGPAVGNAQGAL